MNLSVGNVYIIGSPKKIEKKTQTNLGVAKIGTEKKIMQWLSWFHFWPLFTGPGELALFGTEASNNRLIFRAIKGRFVANPENKPKKIVFSTKNAIIFTLPTFRNYLLKVMSLTIFNSQMPVLFLYPTLIFLNKFVF